jgi:gliding motility-associated-like protein
VFQASGGAGQATGQFRWPIDCGALGQASYQLKFKATSLVCGRQVSDSTLIEVQPQYDNQPPTLTTSLASQTVDVVFGTAIADSVFALDADQDRVSLTAAGAGFNLADYGMSFQPASGKGKAASLFSWSPDCRIRDKSEFTVLFGVQEETCKPSPPPPLAVSFRLRYEAAAAFVPANIFTPNRDGLNDYFELPALPPDFCQSLFSDIRIFNRWGTLVYASRDRHFRWDGANATDGVYFYLINYSDKQFRGTVTKVR